MPSSEVSRTVTFNVGGQHYEVSRSLLEMYPQTMLNRLVSKEWQVGEQDSSAKTHFIDRNGTRFQYVLDWMRDQQVNLSVTESIAALQKELDYFGFDTTKLESSVTVGTLTEIDNVATAVSGNFHAEMDDVEKAIQILTIKTKDLEQQKYAMQTAYMLFGRSSSEEVPVGKTITINLRNKDDKSAAYWARKTPRKLDECLQQYGLRFVRSSGLDYCSTNHTATVTVEKVKRTTDTIGSKVHGALTSAASSEPAAKPAEPPANEGSCDEEPEPNQPQGHSTGLVIAASFVGLLVGFLLRSSL